MEVLLLEDRKRDDDKRRQGYDFYRHEEGVDGGAFLGANDQKPCNSKADHHGRQIDETTCKRPIGQGFGKMNPERVIQKPHKITRPADRYGTRGDGIFQNQSPSDHPGDHLPKNGIGVGIG